MRKAENWWSISWTMRGWVKEKIDRRMRSAFIGPFQKNMIWWPKEYWGLCALVVRCCGYYSACCDHWQCIALRPHMYEHNWKIVDQMGRDRLTLKFRIKCGMYRITFGPQRLGHIVVCCFFHASKVHAFDCFHSIIHEWTKNAHNVGIKVQINIFVWCIFTLISYRQIQLVLGFLFSNIGYFRMENWIM